MLATSSDAKTLTFSTTIRKTQLYAIESKKMGAFKLNLNDY